MTIKAGKSAPDTCVLGALRAFGLVVPLLFDRLSASTASLHVTPSGSLDDAQSYANPNVRATAPLNAMISQDVGH